MKNTIKIIALASTLALSGCFLLPVHKQNVQQGNIITAGMLQAIRPGMSKEQVQFIMGTPILENPFNPNRIDYLYYYKPGYGKTSTRHVVLYFSGDRLTGIAGPFETGPQDSPPQKAADLSEHLAPSLPWQAEMNSNGGLPVPFSN